MGTPWTRAVRKPAAAPDTERRRPSRRDQWPVVCAVSAGGGLGAAARYAADLLWPAPAGAFPWTTFVVNVAGCVLIGALMTLTGGARAPHRLARPFFGTGVLGGFTTFSTYALDVRHLIEHGRPGTGLACLALTPASALLAVWAATALPRRLATKGRAA